MPSILSIKNTYKDFFHNSKLITKLDDIYIDRWIAFRNRNFRRNCSIGDHILNLFRDDLNKDMLKTLFTTYNKLLFFGSSYMLRPMDLDCDDKYHFIKMISQHEQYHHFSNQCSNRLIENLIINDNKFFNFIDFCKMNETLNIIMTICDLYKNNVFLQQMFFNKIFLFKINDIEYVLSNDFINQAVNVTVNNRACLYTNGLIYRK